MAAVAPDIITTHKHGRDIAADGTQVPPVSFHLSLCACVCVCVCVDYSSASNALFNFIIMVKPHVSFMTGNKGPDLHQVSWREMVPSIE